MSGTTSYFGAFQQPIRLIVVGLKVVLFGGKGVERCAVSELKNISLVTAFE